MGLKEKRDKEVFVGKRLFRLLSAATLNKKKTIKYNELILEDRKMYSNHSEENLFLKMSTDFRIYGFEHVQRQFELGTYLMK